jgi:tetratricopeptide (TPR) repeat protein
VLKRLAIQIFIVIFICSSFSLAQTRRLKLKVEGTDGKPIEKVQITLTAPEKDDFKKVVKTNKKGETTFLVHMEIKNLIFLLEKKGYQNLQDQKELRFLRASQEALFYEHTFMMYKVTESTPEQTRLQYETNQQALALFNDGMALFQAEDFAGAAEKFKAAIETKPDFIQAYQNLAAAYFQAESYKEAIEAAEKILEMNPESAQTLRLLSVAYSKLGDEKKAQEYHSRLKVLPEVDFSADELFNMGATAANEGRDEEAAKHFTRATEKKPDFAMAYYQLGVILFRLQKMEEAKAALQKYLELEPDGEHAQNAKTLLEYIEKSSNNS